MAEHVHDGMVHAGPDVERLKSGFLPLDRQFDRSGDVGNVGEVAALAAISQDGDGLVPLDCPLEGFDGQIGTLAGAPDGEEPQGADIEAVEAGVESAPVFAVKLGQRVGTARVGRAVLGKGKRRIRSINAGGRGENEGRDIHAAAEVQQAEGADDIGHLVIQLAVDRRADAGQRGQMDHGVEAEVREHALADVALLEAHPLWQRFLGWQVVEGGDFVPRRM